MAKSEENPMVGSNLDLIYRAYHLPKESSSFAFLTGKYAALSNLALTSDPSSFGIHYSTDGAFSATEQMARLSRTDVNIFVIVAHPADLPEDSMDIEKGAWVGMVTQIGPTPKDEYYLPESGCPEPLSDAVETRFHHTGTWIDRAHRGKGLSRMLIKIALDSAESTSFAKEGIEQVRIRAIMGPTNDLSMSLYGKFGFVRCGTCTINEAMKANGNEGIPFQGRRDWPEEVLSRREGVVVERVTKRSHGE